jgi:tRNA 5-methylaminomethyl-2-thiouridine biosynthesis bifunctional protein
MNKPTAPIIFNEKGEIYSTEFDDIYFDTDSGCQQSQQVFIDGNQLPLRIQQLANNQSSSPFVIAETGFGTGLNFLFLLKTIDQCLQQKNTLSPLNIEFISVEKYPLTQQQLAKALAIVPAVKPYADVLIEQYPTTVTQSFDCYFFHGQVKLTLLYDDATSAYKTLAHKYKFANQKLVDAWFLDGFSPQKNREMWSLQLFEQLALLSKPQATLATFTVAGFVRRGLEQVGFRLQKCPSIGHKKQFLVGRFQQTLTTAAYKLRSIVNKPQRVIVVGGGIAAACTCYVLTQRGIQVTLLCKDKALAQGASSNAIGAIYPLLRLRQDNLSLFYAEAFEFARKFYETFFNNNTELNVPHQWCGVLNLSYKEELVKRQHQFEQQQPWPTQLIHGITASEASNLANIRLPYGGLLMPRAGWISPQQLCLALFEAATKTGRCHIKLAVEVSDMQQQSDGAWLLALKDQQKKLKSNTVIFCTGADSINLPFLNQLPLQAVRGQVTQVNTTDKMKKLSMVLCHKGYVTPALNAQHCIGATFDKKTQSTETTITDDEKNLAQLHQCLPNVTDWQLSDVTQSKARVRCMTPDHFPVVGVMPKIEEHRQQYARLAKDKHWPYQTRPSVYQGLYMLTGLGARGLCTAPILAEILAAELCQTPYPVNDDLLFELAPNRFVIRELIKQQ